MFSFLKPFKTSNQKIDAVTKRLTALEEWLKSAIGNLEQRASFEFINEATKTLGQKALKNNHNYNYLGERFREYELALMNVKQMGYYIGLMEAAKVGAFDKMKIVAKQSDVRLTSKICTQEDCQSDWYYYWLQELCCGFSYHRKLWEFCFIAQTLYVNGALKEGKRGLGFGCGAEPLPSLFAKYGATVVATDLDPGTSEEQGAGWMASGQHTGSLEKILQSNVCPDTSKFKNISHEFVDMNFIPGRFDGEFDFCWSACSLEHVGSIALGLEFIRNSMKTLKPGGIAVHTTEFNLDDGETIDNSLTVLFQRRHLEDIKSRLENDGYIVSPFDFDAGSGVLNGLFDIPPWPWDVAKLNWKTLEHFTHLKLSIAGFPCTSVAMIITKPL